MIIGYLATGRFPEKQNLILDKENKRIHLSSPWWLWSLRGLSILAFILSAVLSWHFLTGGAMVGCGGGSSCDQVLSSQWSMIAGMLPVSGLAMGVYLAVLFASFYISPNTELPVRRLAWKVLLVLAGLVAGSAVWFTILQKWIIGEFCFYCMITHITGLAITALLCWKAIKGYYNHSNDIEPKNQAEPDNIFPDAAWYIINPKPVIGFILTGLVLAVILAVGQVGFASSAVYHNGSSQENLPVFDYKNVPMTGSPNAPYVVTVLFDYQCPHCQKIHFMLTEAVHRYKGKLAFVLCPTPLNTQCNPYIPRDVDAFKNSCELARIGLGVWLTKRDAFPAFENWMFSYESGDRWHPRNMETARAKAIELVGEAGFDSAWSDPWIESYMSKCVQIFGQTLQEGKGGIPKLVYGSRWVIPEPNNTDNLIGILQKSLTLPKP